MSKLQRVVMAGAVALFTIGPAAPALATHRCGLDRLDPTVNAICEAHPGDAKTLVGYLFCLVSPTC